jgi:hypothetical protein
MLYEKKFWIVWCPQSIRNSYVRHTTEQSAIKEAQRLACKEPNKEFVVMSSVCFYKPITTTEFGVTNK